jgi:hypothetical protein
MAEPDLQAVLDEVARAAGETRRHFDVVTERLRGEYETTATRLDGQALETRRHFDVVAEDLRSDLRLLAEGLGGLSERVNSEFASFRAEVASEFSEVRAMIKFSYSDLDRRLTGLETTVETLQQRVTRIENSLAH